ncbi:MAG TPA: BBP7 family outer membrane beta-barrel protein [Gemmataceae bacterium]|nr:BBP7 family outer membrane beta-barrel protein [Gemmataceae bacterium]
MMRILLGLGCTVAIGSGGLVAQDAAPAARLGQPAATLGRPVPSTVRAQAPELAPAVGFDIPKVMPKGTLTESPGASVPGTLPVPAAVPRPTGPVVTVPPTPGAISGPVVTGPVGPIPGPVVGPPIPTGPIVTDPFAGDCPVGGCPVPMGVHSNNSGWYTSVEGLLWYVKSYSVPALVTAGPAFSGATLATPGVMVLTAPSIDTNPRYGARFTLGYWMAPDWAVELTAFYIRPGTDKFTAFSTQFPTMDLARPFLDVNNGVESSEIIGRPGVASGYVRTDSESNFYGAELNARYRWRDGCTFHIDALAGLRYLYLEERLTIEEQTLGLAQAGPMAGVERFLTDEFATRNQFYGGQLGAIFTYQEGPWTISLTAKVAAGVNRRTTRISGSITPISGGAPPSLPGGLLALNSNIGVHTDQKFSVVPELGLNIGYDLTDRLRVFAGYSFLYWTNVVRPGSQIDRGLDVNRIPDFPAGPVITGMRPASRIQSENIWVQGVNVGILFKW